jgi:transposase
MEPKEYFQKPAMPEHRHYEALKAYYCDGMKANDAAAKFGLSPKYFKKLRHLFLQKLKQGSYPFFSKKKTGPKKRRTDSETIELIVSLRKRNCSVSDIKVFLDSKGKKISIETIDRILKAEGFAPLPKRTRGERLSISLPGKIRAPKSVPLETADEEFTTECGAGPLVFLPLLEKLGIVEAIKAAGYPETNGLSDVQTVLSFLALKLPGGLRWSHDTKWNMDRALGMFAGLNVLPKSTTLSTYSYRITRAQNRNLLKKLSGIFRDEEIEEGEFNLDFKAIPHWGDSSVLEKNWAGSRSKAMKSILSMVVQDPSTGNLSYTDAEIKRKNHGDAILHFVDFWKSGRGVAPKMLIFDSKLTTYRNLNELDKCKENIKFLTIRRRSKSLIEKAEKIDGDQWKKINIERSKGKWQRVGVHDGKSKLRDYEGEIRQIVLTDHGRRKPTFLITNDFDIEVRDLIKKYARRWLVEQEIAEHIAFFNLNNPSSSIVVKVDFDLTISLLAHNLYRILSGHLNGFERCTAETISRKFLENGAKIVIKGDRVAVHLKKKTHLPILFEVPWMQDTTKLSWSGLSISYATGTCS